VLDAAHRPLELVARADGHSLFLHNGMGHTDTTRLHFTHTRRLQPWPAIPRRSAAAKDPDPRPPAPALPSRAPTARGHRRPGENVGCDNNSGHAAIMLGATGRLVRPKGRTSRPVPVAPTMGLRSSHGSAAPKTPHPARGTLARKDCHTRKCHTPPGPALPADRLSAIIAAARLPCISLWRRGSRARGGEDSSLADKQSESPHRKPPRATCWFPPTRPIAPPLPATPRP
jgi:hypothetical protein